MEPKKVSSNLIVRKMAALEKGELTDCTFLVGGLDGSRAQEFHACKFDLITASDFFAKILKNYNAVDPISGKPAYIWLQHVQPQIFKLVLEYVHMSGQLESKVNDLEQCLKLAAAADEFMLDGLGQMCVERINNLVNLDNVWKIFSENHSVKFTSAACEKLLCSNTNVCLMKPAFLKVDEETVAKFLQFDKMNIQSEMDLVRACLRYAKSKGNEREVFRRCALPHLRLLTLDAKQLSELAPFLNQEEKMFLSLNLMQEDPLLLRKGLDENALNLCKVKAKRNCGQAERTLSNLTDAGTIDLIADQSVFDLKTLFQKENYETLKYDNRFSMNFESKHAIKITNFGIICEINWNLFSRESKQRTKSSSAFLWDSEGTVVTAMVVGNGKFEESGALKPNSTSGPVANFQRCFIIPKGCLFKLEVIMKQGSVVARVPAKDIVSSEGTCTFQQQEWNFLNHAFETARKTPIISIFKGFSYEKIK